MMRRLLGCRSAARHAGPVRTAVLAWPAMAQPAMAQRTMASQSRPSMQQAPPRRDSMRVDEKTEAYRKAATHEAEEDAAERRALQQSPLIRKQIHRALWGNLFVASIKFGVYLQSGSSAVLSEAIHTLADCGNQVLLSIGHAEASKPADKAHPFGYGRAAFFWSMASGVGIFFSGAGIAFGAGLTQVLHPGGYHISQEMILVMAFSFCMDGYVLAKTLHEESGKRAPGVSMLRHLREMRNPITRAIILEDMAACAGIAVASAGIGLTHLTGAIAFDTLACFSVAALMASVGGGLAVFNRKYLIGVAVDDEIIKGIETIVLGCPSVKYVRDIETQWVGPNAFMLKAEIDFSGEYLSSQLEATYLPLILSTRGEDRDQMVGALRHYAEDVTRRMEVEVRMVESAIREKYPEAAFIHLEPDSKNSFLMSLRSARTLSGRHVLK